MWYYILIIVWAVGAVISLFFAKKWGDSIPTRVATILLWPLTLILYGIYYIHKKI